MSEKRLFDETVFNQLLSECNPLPGEYLAKSRLRDFIYSEIRRALKDFAEEIRVCKQQCIECEHIHSALERRGVKL